MTDGLYQKFRVERVDGGDLPGGKHSQCCYFVLDLTCDPSAIPAIKAYAAACAAGDPALAAHLLLSVRGSAPPGPVDASPGPAPETRTCNRHVDCDAADAKAQAEGRPWAEHCRNESCDECFGS